MPTDRGGDVEGRYLREGVEHLTAALTGELDGYSNWREAVDAGRACIKSTLRRLRAASTDAPSEVRCTCFDSWTGSRQGPQVSGECPVHGTRMHPLEELDDISAELHDGGHYGLASRVAEAVTELRRTPTKEPPDLYEHLSCPRGCGITEGGDRLVDSTCPVHGDAAPDRGGER